MSKTIVFFGTDEFSAVSLRALLAKGFNVSAVVTKPDSTKGRGRKLTISAVKLIAEENNIPILQPVKVSDLTEQVSSFIKKSDDSPVGVLVSYGKIIPQSVIDLFEPGIINIHPSLLPRYRGPSPIEAAIINGDEETGVTIMQLSKDMDAGPIYIQTTLQLTGTETAPWLESHLAEVGATELTRVLPEIIDGILKAEPQIDSHASYCKLLDKKDAELNLSELTAAEAERQVRAYLNFPKSKLVIQGHQVVITKAKVLESIINETTRDNNEPTDESSPLTLTCRDGNFLEIEELIGPSGKSMNAKAFINGYLKTNQG